MKALFAAPPRPISTPAMYSVPSVDMAELVHLRRRVEELTASEAAAVAKCVHVERVRDKFMTDATAWIVAARLEAQGASARAAAAETAATAAENEVANTNARIAALTTELTSSVSKCADLTTRLQALTSEAAALKTKATALEERVTRLEAEKEALRKRVGRLKPDVEGERCPLAAGLVTVARGVIPLGAGSHGTVLPSQLACAVKVPRSVSSVDLWREITLHRQLCHPHIVAVYGGHVGADSKPQMVMELCAGGDLDQRLHPDEGNEQPPLEQRVEWMRQVLSALVYLHERDIIHADLKPANILLDTPGAGARAKVTDFGLSKVRADSSFVHASDAGPRGTWLYMDPLLMDSGPARRAEAAAGAGGAAADPETESGAVRKASDVFSAGVMLWECVTGRRPYDTLLASWDRAVQQAKLTMHVNSGGRPSTADEVSSLSPAGVGALIQSMWSPSWKDRPTAQQALDELRRLFGTPAR